MSRILISIIVQFRVLTSVFALLLFSACTIGYADDYSDAVGDEINLRVSASVVSNPTDVDNYISSLRIIVVERNNGIILSNTVFDSDKIATGVFRVRAKKTNMKLYFIANERSSMTTALDGVVDEQSLLNNPACSEEIYSSTSYPSANNPFLMTAIIDVVIPFDWKNNEIFIVPTTVQLTRVATKITFSLKKNFTDITEIDNKKYKSIVRVLDTKIIRVPATHNLFSSGTVYNGQFHANDVALEASTSGDYDSNDYWHEKYKSIYIPEHIPSKASLYFVTVIAVKMEHCLVEENNPTNIYKDLRTERTFYIPIKTPTDNYNLRRNNHYIVNCILTKWNDDIYSQTEILPWNKKVVDVEFAAPKYDWTIYNEAKDPVGGFPVISVISPAVKYGFCLQAPKAARWKAVLTNEVDFRLTDDNLGTVDSSKYFTIGVEATAPLGTGLSVARTTDLVIFINDKEEIRISNITQVRI